MKQRIQSKFQAKILNNLPIIKMLLEYQDDFSNDSYVVITDPNKTTGAKHIELETWKNGKKINELTLINENVDKLFSDLLESVDDYDFKNTLLKENDLPNIKNQLGDFLSKYNELVLPTMLTTEGEVKRMRKLAGIL